MVSSKSADHRVHRFWAFFILLPNFYWFIITDRRHELAIRTEGNTPNSRFVACQSWNTVPVIIVQNPELYGIVIAGTCKDLCPWNPGDFFNVLGNYSQKLFGTWECPLRIELQDHSYPSSLSQIQIVLSRPQVAMYWPVESQTTDFILISDKQILLTSFSCPSITATHSNSLGFISQMHRWESNPALASMVPSGDHATDRIVLVCCPSRVACGVIFRRVRYLAL